MPAHDELARFRLEPTSYSILTDSTQLQSAIKTLLGGNYVWHFPSMFRELSAHNEGLLPYHQDITYNLRYKRLLTCWTPLTDCGKDSPGLEMVLKYIKKKHDHLTRFPKWEHGMSEQEAREYTDNAPTWAPEFSAGDVMLFHELTLHRSYSTPNMTGRRLSLDARAVPYADLTEELKKTRRYLCPDKAEFIR